MMGAAAAIAAWISLRRGASAADSAAAKPEEVRLRNPFSLTEASKFAAFFTVVLLVVKLVQMRFPGKGLYMVAGLAGLTDVDAILHPSSELIAGGLQTTGADVASSTGPLLPSAAPWILVLLRCRE